MSFCFSLVEFHRYSGAACLLDLGLIFILIMPTRRQPSKDCSMEKKIACSTEACPLLTKFFLPKIFDCTKTFICGFCTSRLQNEPKIYSSVLLDNLTKGNKARSCIAREIRQEQHEQDSKKSSLIIKGTTPIISSNDHEVVTKIARSIDVDIQSNQIESKKIGKAGEINGRQLLLVKFKCLLKRKEVLRNSAKLKDTNDYSAIFVDLVRTKSEREAQYQLRIEKRSLENKYSDKAFVMRKGRVIEKRG